MWRVNKLKQLEKEGREVGVVCGAVSVYGRIVEIDGDNLILEERDTKRILMFPAKYAIVTWEQE